MSVKKKERDQRIKEDIRLLHASGIKIKDAILIIADKYSLSDSRTQEIWYNKKVNYHTGHSIGTKLKAYVIPTLILTTVFTEQFISYI